MFRPVLDGLDHVNWKGEPLKSEEKLLGCPGKEVIGSMVNGSVGYPKEYPIYK